MYTSDIKKSRIAWLAAAVFVFIFSRIYEYFSHNVYSAYMTRAFLIPLAGWIISEIILFLAAGRGMKCAPDLAGPLMKRTIFACEILAGGVIWLTLGSIYEGVLEIYGTTNRLIIVFVIAGAAQVIAAAILLCRALVSCRVMSQ